MTFREEIDHRRTKSCLAATPGSDTSLFLRLNLSAHKTGLCPSVTNNQEGTGGGTLVLSNVRACVCTRVVPSSNSVVMGDQISMVWEWSHTHTDTQCVCQRLSPSWTSANRLSAIWWGSDTNGSRREILKKKKKKILVWLLVCFYSWSLCLWWSMHYFVMIYYSVFWLSAQPATSASTDLSL